MTGPPSQLSVGSRWPWRSVMSPPRSRPRSISARCYWAKGDYRRAAGFLRSNVDRLVGPLARERFGMPFVPSVIAVLPCLLFGRARSVHRGNYAERRRTRLPRLPEVPFSLTAAYRGLGYVWLRKGDALRAIPVLEQGLAVCQEWKIDLLFVSVGYPLGCAYLTAGRLAEGKSLLGRALSVLRPWS